ncbi:MAG: chromosome segregation protein SMC, partial [Xanthomonadales bacterium]|nr:chromosome segregation protein SMC [Xanthomonadales bacterium]
MRLSTIKLAGFKSFVDPTTFQAPTNLTGIVGPNGCGKSNIIDAVRWVMGEGSAKVLRGESMADVIFSGSSTRKPVGTAQVELIFDNASGRVAGQFAGYNEISVKRTVSRDGVSLYYLNGTRCRRKDVRDLFLGTGLGSRSYSIIEQGMISEVVDAKPEEIRGHLEEAAGISKYKERRRETERRIQHTRDNLSRLTDLREEVGKHISRLKRQANAAVRYKKLKQEKRELESRLATLRWKALMDEAGQGQQRLAKKETALQESIARQRAAEAALEKLHEEQVLAGEAYNEVQGELYSVGSEIARLEQTIQHARELHERQQTEYQETEAALRDLEKHMVLDKAQVEDLSASLAEVEPRLSAAREEEDRAVKALTEADAAVSQWQKAFEQHHQASTERNREADRSRSEIEVLDQRLLQASRRIEALDREAGTIGTAGMQKELAALEAESKKLAAEEKTEQGLLDELRKQLTAAREERQAAEEWHRAVQRDLHTREGRLASLNAMQQAALEDKSAEAWLQEQGLHAAPRLAKVLSVEAGWEAAVEVVLGHWLQSVMVKAGNEHGNALAGLEQASMDLIEDRRGSVQVVPGSLAEKVRAPDTVIAWLNAVQTADSLEQAWSGRGLLDETASLVTAAGEWIGHGWLRVARGRAGQDSMLEREKMIARLDKDVTRLTAEEAGLAEQVAKSGADVSRLDAEIQQLQAVVNALHRRRNEVDGQLESRQSSIGMLHRRQKAISEESAQLREQVVADDAMVSEARGRLESQVSAMAGLQDERDALEAQRSELMALRDSSRNKLGEARNLRHELELKTGSRRASLDSLRQSLERMDTQLSQLQARYVGLSEQIAMAKEPGSLHREEMEVLLARRVDTETRLAEARARVQALENDYHAKDGERQ